MFFACISKKKLIVFITAFVLGLVSVVALSVTPFHQVFFGGNLKKLPIYCVQTEEKKVAISFDCAWGTDYTDDLLNIMKDEGVRCTFFAVEFWSKKHPDYLKKIATNGHEIGTHSSTHPYMSKLNKDAIIQELTTSSQAIESVTGVKVDLFRAPYGDYNDLLIDTATELGLYTIQWDVDSLDWKDLSAKDIENRVVKKVKNGSIVLFHNQGLNTAKALPNIIKTLKNKG